MINRQSIAWRLAIALGAVLLLIGLVSVSCLWALFDIHHRLHALKQEEDEVRNVVRLASAVRDQYAHVAHTIILENESHTPLFREATQHLDQLVTSVKAQPRARGAPEIDRIVRTSREIERLFDRQILPAIREDDHAEVASRHERILHLAMSAQEQAEALARRSEASMEDLSKHVRATQHGAILFTVVAHLTALMAAILIGLYVYRTMARPIARLSAAAARVGAGDLDTQIAVEREDELGLLSRRFNEMTSAVKEHQHKLLHAERLMGLASMSAGIAHELNNPLGVILGYAKLLRRRGGPPDEKVLAAIEEEAERCRQVVDGLLDLTRGGILHSEAVDVRALVEDLVAALRVKGVPPGISIEIRGHAAAVGDAAKLRQALTNLIANAIEACGVAGRVVLLVDDSLSGGVTVEVHDTGGGLTAAARERVFEPFFTTKPTGSGLGLAIARAIARAHGGDVTIVSTTDRGTIFRLTVPKKKEATA